MRSFEQDIRVQQTDIDVLGHVNNITYVRWVQELAVTHSLVRGLDFEAYQRIGGIFVVRQHKIDYLLPVSPGGHVHGCTTITAMTAAKCRRTTEFYRDGVLVTRATTLWGFVEVETGRPTRIADEIYKMYGLAGPGELKENGEWVAKTFASL